MSSHLLSEWLMAYRKSKTRIVPNTLFDIKQLQRMPIQTIVPSERQSVAPASGNLVSWKGKEVGRGKAHWLRVPSARSDSPRPRCLLPQHRIWVQRDRVVSRSERAVGGGASFRAQKLRRLTRVPKCAGPCVVSVFSVVEYQCTCECAVCCKVLVRLSDCVWFNHNWINTPLHRCVLWWVLIPAGSRLRVHYRVHTGLTIRGLDGVAFSSDCSSNTIYARPT